MIDLFLPEGATPIDDASGLKLAWIRTRDQLNEAEAENILAAYSKHFRAQAAPTKWFTPPHLLALHRDMVTVHVVPW